MTVYSNHSKISVRLELLITPQICNQVQNNFINKNIVIIPKNIKLADPRYYKPNEIDTGVSLNNCLRVGPTIHQDLFSIILLFRMHQIALTADIKQMYRQIAVDDADSQYQKILYRGNDDEPIKFFRTKTVTYGTACASFPVIRSHFELTDIV